MNGSPDGEIEGNRGRSPAPINVPNSKSTETSEGLPPLVGRIRRLHKNKEWGLIYSEVPLLGASRDGASCDVFLEAANAEDISSLEQGDFVIFEIASDEYEQYYARNVRKAVPAEVDAQQALLIPYFERFRSEQAERARGSSASSNRVAELPSGGASTSMVSDGTSSMMLPRGDAIRDASSLDVSGPLAQSALQNAAMANAALGAPARGHQMAIHHELSAPPTMLPPQLESQLPHQMPPPPAHPAPGGASEGAFNNYLQTAQQAYGGYPPPYGQDMHGQMYHQGINQWQPTDAGSSQMNPMSGIAEHEAVKILEEPLPTLENLNPKDMVNMLTGRGGSQRKGRKFTTRVNSFGLSLGREFAEILRSAADMHSHTEHDAQDQWANWHWWVTPQSQGDAQMSSHHVFHGAVQHGGHGVLATSGMTR